MAGADGSEGNAARPLQIHDTTTGEVAFEGARRLLIDLHPCRVGDRGKLAMQIIHAGSPLREPMPREPSNTGGTDCPGPTDAGAGCAAGAASGVTSSRNAADATKNRLPVTARLKSRMRS